MPHVDRPVESVINDGPERNHLGTAISNAKVKASNHFYST